MSPNYNKALATEAQDSNTDHANNSAKHGSDSLVAPKKAPMEATSRKKKGSHSCVAGTNLRGYREVVHQPKESGSNSSPL